MPIKYLVYDPWQIFFSSTNGCAINCTILSFHILKTFISWKMSISWISTWIYTKFYTRPSISWKISFPKKYLYSRKYLYCVIFLYTVKASIRKYNWYKKRNIPSIILYTCLQVSVIVVNVGSKISSFFLGS